LYIDFYSTLLHVSAVYVNHHRAGILVYKNSKRGERPLLTNSGYKIIVKFIIIIPKAE